MFPGKFFSGFAAGFAAGYFTREITPFLKEVARPLTKAAIRKGLEWQEKAEETLAHFGETIEDLTAEVVAEKEQQRKQATSAEGESRGDEEDLEEDIFTRSEMTRKAARASKPKSKVSKTTKRVRSQSREETVHASQS